MSTSCTLSLAEGMYCRGTILSCLMGTCDERDAGGSVFAFSVRDAFGDGDGLVGGEVGDVVGRWCSNGGGGFEDLGWGHEWIFEVSLSFDEDGAD
jgi:hypothetical protein